MNELNPSRVQLARKRRGLSGKELSDLTGITAVHISRIEKGKAKNIEESTIETIAKALMFPKDFFFGPDIDFPTKDTASFRSLTAMTARERESALTAGSFAYMVSDWVSERFNLPEPDLLDLSCERQPETAARTLRSHWGLGEKPISNTIKLLESKGIRVFSLSEKTQNVDAFSCWRNGVPYIFLNTFKTSERSRFDALHELGHLVLHRHGRTQGREAEVEANKFASYFLIPQLDLVANIPLIVSLNQLVKIKKRWGVSVAALAYRLHKIEALSDWQYRTFCIQINKQFGKTEPNGLEREVSVVWEKILKALWKDGQTRLDIARDLSLPENELEELLFGLIGTDSLAKVKIDSVKKPNLSLVKN
jgi:Zn-dependent peptidase ImmA (M78 family)/DNA-binding Xre family transcriptional regulator